jgi:hypothetical protein
MVIARPPLSFCLRFIALLYDEAYHALSLLVEILATPQA